MPRKTQQNNITSPELLEKINPKNKRLIEDYLMYLTSVQRSDNTVESYRNDLEIFFVWCLQNADNKFFIDVSKRDIVSYQNFLIYTNKNSPARVRRLKATLSSLSNYIENILDDEYPNFRNIIKKVESPINQPSREKTVFEDEDIDTLLDMLCEKQQYQKACALALAASSGRRKSELTRFKVSYFNDENIIYGSLYKTPEKVKTKGRGTGKFLNLFVLASKFKPYFDLWMKQRAELGVESEWLLVNKDKNGNWVQIDPDTLNSWALTFSNMIGKDFYFHSLRHYFTTTLLRNKLPATVVKEIIGWDSVEMVNLYNDATADEQLGEYFDENGIKENTVGSLNNL